MHLHDHYGSPPALVVQGEKHACKTMHLLHALLFNRLKIRISILKGSEVMVWQLKFISIEIGRYENILFLFILFFVFIK